MLMKKYCLLILLILSFSVVKSQLKLAGIFGNHMVIQQGMQAPVWGKAHPGATVRVDFAGYTTIAKADNDGKWMLRMPELPAGGPFEMKVSSNSKITLTDIMVGEVWLASGQSNMAMATSSTNIDANRKDAEDDYKNIRLFTVPDATASIPLDDITTGEWKICNKGTVKDFSAVGYFFGRELFNHSKNPVGIINVSKGATNVETWMSADMLASIPEFRNKVLTRDNDLGKWNAFVKKSQEAEKYREVTAQTANKGVQVGVNLLKYKDNDWKKATAPMDMARLGLNGYWGFVWIRKYIDLTEADINEDLTTHLVVSSNYNTFYFNGVEIGKGKNELAPKQFSIPKKLLQAGKNVLAIKMVVYWGTATIGLKGEEANLFTSNTHRKILLDGEWLYNSSIEPELPKWQDYYNRDNVLYNARIAPIIPFGIKGVLWYQGEANASRAALYKRLFPMLIEDWRVRWKQGYFPFLYVQLANYKEKKNIPVEDDWAELREAQLQTLSYPNTGMASAIDIGDANDIHPKNKLEVGKRLFLAARKIAYQEDLVYSGPTYDSMKVEGSKIRIYFSSTGSGLVAKNNTDLKGFSIAGADKKFFWANAVIKGNEVEVSCDKVMNPLAVRYSWESNPDGNLYNKEGLPASPFRTDQWTRNGK